MDEYALCVMNGTECVCADFTIINYVKLLSTHCSHTIERNSKTEKYVNKSQRNSRLNMLQMCGH